MRTKHITNTSWTLSKRPSTWRLSLPDRFNMAAHLQVAQVSHVEILQKKQSHDPVAWNPGWWNEIVVNELAFWRLNSQFELYINPWAPKKNVQYSYRKPEQQPECPFFFTADDPSLKAGSQTFPDHVKHTFLKKLASSYKASSFLGPAGGPNWIISRGSCVKINHIWNHHLV